MSTFQKQYLAKLVVQYQSKDPVAQHAAPSFADHAHSVFSENIPDLELNVRAGSAGTPAAHAQLAIGAVHLQNRVLLVVFYNILHTTAVKRIVDAPREVATVDVVHVEGRAAETTARAGSRLFETQIRVIPAHRTALVK